MESNNRRVVITGMGVISCVGKTVDTFWDSISGGKSGIGILECFDSTDFDVKIAGEIKDFNAEDYGISKKEVRRLDRYLQFALAASELATQDSKLQVTDENCERFGACVSSGIGGMSTFEAQHDILMHQGPSRVSPFFIPMMIANMSSGHVSLRHNLKGPNFCIITACATGCHSIGESFHIIKRGDADVMYAGGTEASITKSAYSGFANMHAISKAQGDPKTVSRPFDLNRNGFVMSEGCGVLILEELEHALARGAKIHAEIVGFGMTADANHITNPCPDGNGAARAMKMALRCSGLQPDDIGYLNAHGTSTPLGDLAETLAIKSIFADKVNDLHISSTKSIMGHALGAAGAIESVACIMAMKTGIIPPTINYETPDPECDLNYTPNIAVKKEIKYAMNNSFGFGGQNAVLIYKKYE